MRALAVTAILLAVTLAGCATESDPTPTSIDGPILDTLSEAVYDILPVEELFVAASDGKGMHTAIYRPDTDAPVPVFINFSPYWGDTAEERGDAFSQYMIDEYVPRGYAVVLAAIRGTGHSEGCFSIGGDRELEDLYDVVDHFANAEWSNGAIAAGGKSYDSTTQNGMIAKFPHPALKGIFHVSGISDMYAYNYHNGVPYATGPIFNTYYYAQGTDEYGVSLIGAGGTDDEDPESLARLIDDVACPDLPFVQAHGIGSGVTGQKTDYWVERDWTRHIGDSDWNGSIFFVHGLQDWNVKPDHILPWIDNLPEQIRVKGWLHQAGHVYPERQDWNQTMLSWLDSELKGKNTGFWDAPAWDVRSDDGAWYQEDQWPPTQHLVVRGNEHTFNATTRLTGDLVVSAAVEAQHADPVIAFAVYDETGGQRTWVTEGFLRGIYYRDLETAAVLAPGDTFPVSMRSYPFDHVFEEGSKLVIDWQVAPRNGVTTEAHLAGAVVSEPVALARVGTAEPMTEQPRDMECFAC